MTASLICYDNSIIHPPKFEYNGHSEGSVKKTAVQTLFIPDLPRQTLRNPEIGKVQLASAQSQYAQGHPDGSGRAREAYFLMLPVFCKN